MPLPQVKKMTFTPTTSYFSITVHFHSLKFKLPGFEPYDGQENSQYGMEPGGRPQ
jgi:hypothetical protein